MRSSSSSSALERLFTWRPIGHVPELACNWLSIVMSMQEISDRLEITDMLTRYCYAVDDRDWNAYRDIFTADAAIDDRRGRRRARRRRGPRVVPAAGAREDAHLTACRLDNAHRGRRRRCSRMRTLLMPDGDRCRRREARLLSGALISRQAGAHPGGWRILELTEEGYWTHNLSESFAFE
jgi:hypothetical protein